MIVRKNITAIILAGGMSRRMGTDKGLITLNGKAFTQHIIDAVTPYVGAIIIVSNNEAFDVFGQKRVADMITNAGPLAGIYSGLHHSKTEDNIILSCDVPLINGAVLSQLITQIDSESDVVQIESEGIKMPLIASYKKHCTQAILNQLQAGERRLQTAVNQLNTKTVALDASLNKAVRNINTKVDLNNIKDEHNN